MFLACPVMRETLGVSNQKALPLLQAAQNRTRSETSVGSVQQPLQQLPVETRVHAAQAIALATATAGINSSNSGASSVHTALFKRARA